MKVQHTDRIKIALHTRVNANTDLETMKTPAVQVGSQLLDFLENGARLRLFENREDHMPLSLETMTPSGKDFIRPFSKKSLGSAPILRLIRSVKTLK